MSAPLKPLVEPDTIVARPSAVTWSRVIWLVLSVLVSATWFAGDVWIPWLFIPLLCGATVTDGWLSACVWALVAGLLIDLMPPASSAPGLSALPLLVVVAVAWRLRSWWSASLTGPFGVGALTCIAGLTTLAGLHAEASGAFSIEWRDDALCALSTATLTALVVPLWVRWAKRLRQRGRA